MARVKYGFGISSIDGKVGGSVFSKTLAGSVLKNKSKNSRKSVGAVTVVRANLAAVQNAWSALTESQRKVWNAFTQFSPTQIKRSAENFLNGQQLFLKYNTIRLQYGLVILEDPAFSSCGFSDVTFDLRLTGSELFLDSSRVAVPADEFFICSVSGPVRCTLNNPGSRLRSMVFVTTAIAAFNLTTAYEAVFGSVPPAGTFVFFKASRIDILSPLIGTFSLTKIEL